MSSQLVAPSCEEEMKRFSVDRAEGSGRSRRERRARGTDEPRRYSALQGETRSK